MSTDSATRYARRADRSAPSAPTSIPVGESDQPLAEPDRGEERRPLLALGERSRDRIDQAPPEPDPDAAADHDPIDVEHQQHRLAAPRQRRHRVVADGDRPRVAGVGGRPRARPPARRCRRRASAPINALPEATVSMQPTWPHRHGSSPCRERDVADLAGRAREPRDDLAVDHEPGGDSPVPMLR